MKDIHNLFFDEESSIGDMIWFYGCLTAMLAIGISTLRTCSPHLVPFLLIGIATVFLVVWIWAKKESHSN